MSHCSRLAVTSGAIALLSGCGSGTAPPPPEPTTNEEIEALERAEAMIDAKQAVPAGYETPGGEAPAADPEPMPAGEASQ